MTNRLFFDTEFVDTGAKIILLSIGVVRDEDGATYYAEVEDAPIDRADGWVHENVIPKLTRFSGMVLRDEHALMAPLDSQRWLDVVKPREQIADELVTFAGTAPQWWAYMASYDWVTLSQIYGPLVRRPEGWPFAPFDVYQHFMMAGLSGPTTDWVPAPQDEHHALADAQWDRRLFHRIQDHCREAVDLQMLVLP